MSPVVLADPDLATQALLDLLRALHERCPDLPVVLLTAHGVVPSVAQAMRAGAFDYVTKPFDNDELRLLVGRACEIRRLERENRWLRREIDDRFGPESMVAESPQSQAALGLVRRAPPSRASVLIQGESDTGKELVGRARSGECDSLPCESLGARRCGASGARLAWPLLSRRYMNAPASFDESPFMVFWETTRACDLACRHCRADAQPHRDRRELDTSEGKALFDEVREMGCPLVVLTGGDPAKRGDIVDLVRHGTEIGLRVALTPSATPLVTSEWLAALRDAGLARLAVSVDSADPQTHDDFRGVAGSHARTLEILRDARALGIPTQVNTTVTADGEAHLDRMLALLATLQVSLWGVFLLVPTGRGRRVRGLEREPVERLLERLAQAAQTAPFDIKTTAAPQYRRVLLQRRVHRQEIVGIDDGIGRAPRGVNDGQGIVFVSHRGWIQPSGFLPVVCGSVRREGLKQVYREHPMFRALRDSGRLGGKCGECEFRRVCGGSRARAFAATGDFLAEDPACAYVPKATSRLAVTNGLAGAR